MREGSLMDFNFTFRARGDFHVYHHFPGLPAVLSPIVKLGERIMQSLDELKLEQQGLVNDLADLKTVVLAGNDKGDVVILKLTQVIDALAVLVNASNTGGNVTAADIEPILAQARAARTEVAGMKVELVTQGTEADTAATAADTALNNVPPVTP